MRLSVLKQKYVAEFDKAIEQNGDIMVNVDKFFGFTTEEKIVNGKKNTILDVDEQDLTGEEQCGRMINIDDLKDKAKAEIIKTIEDRIINAIKANENFIVLNNEWLKSEMIMKELKGLKNEYDESWGATKMYFQSIRKGRSNPPKKFLTKTDFVIELRKSLKSSQNYLKRPKTTNPIKYKFYWVLIPKKPYES